MDVPHLRAVHLLVASAALERVLRGEAAADRVLEALHRRHRAGARDRALTTRLLFGVLRRYFSLRAALGAAPSALELCALEAARAGLALPAMAEFDREALRARAATVPAADPCDQPGWLWERLRAQHGPQEAAALAAALNGEAPVHLRVNTLKATRAQARAALAAEGIEAEPVADSPAALRLARRAALARTRTFRSGLVEVQDAGSQRLADFVGAEPGETIADFCAGAGGKTLALGARMRDRGHLHALDTDRARLARLAPRLHRAGLTLVQPRLLRGGAAPRDLAGRCDRVLVDAPCSGSGTLRRNPALRLRAPDLPALARRQLAILHQAARLLRPGGRLVYATCSVLAEENEDVVRRFLHAHPGFVALGSLRLLPHRGDCDGFYAAALSHGARAAPSP